MSLFIGRLGRDVRTSDLEDVFRRYGKMNRCEVKGNGFGFVDFDDKRDAEDALAELSGREIRGSRIVVEWAKGPGRRAGSDECFKCGRPGHFARDCERGGGGGRGRSPDRYRRRSPSPYRRRSPSPRRRRSPSPRRSRSRTPIRRSRSPVRRSRSPVRRSRSRSPARSPPRSPARSPPRSPAGRAGGSRSPSPP